MKAGTLSLRELNRAALARQMLLERENLGVVEAVERLAGMQAQYSPSPYIGLWTRLSRFRIEDLEVALHERKVVKASLMRWTLHLASARDYPYFARTMADMRAAQWHPDERWGGMDAETLHARLLEFAAEPRLIEEIRDFTGSMVPPDPERYPLAPVHAATARGWLVHVPPSGTWKYFGKNRYISTREWLGQKEEPPLDEAITHMVRRYLAAFGPATRSDVVNWSGLRRVGQVDDAIGALGDEVAIFEDESGKTLYDLASSPRPGADVRAPVRYLPKWDNLLLAYDKRERVLPEVYRKVVIRKNGDVLPTFLVDGVVAGVWSSKVERRTAVLAPEPFSKLDRATSAELEEEGDRLIRFIEPEAKGHEVNIGPPGL